MQYNSIFIFFIIIFIFLLKIKLPVLNKHRQFTNIIIFSDYRLVIILYFYVTIPAHAGTCGD